MFKLFCVLLAFSKGAEGLQGRKEIFLENFRLLEEKECHCKDTVDTTEVINDDIEEGMDDTVKNNENGTNFKKYRKEEQLCQEQQIHLLLLFVVFIFIIILMVLSEWADPRKILRRSKLQLVVSED